MANVRPSGGPSAGDKGPIEAMKPTNSTAKFAVEYIPIHGHQIGYRRGGQGPVLLLLHGIAGSSLTWVPAMRLLQSDYTVLAPDFLGHGASEKPLGDYSLGNHATVMRDLLNLLGIDRVTVVGQSFGGGVAMQFSYQFPERCERLVLVDAGGLGREVNWILRLMTLPGAEYVMPALFPAFVRDWGDTVVKFFGGRGFRNAEALEMWRSYRSLTEGESRRAFVRTVRSVIDPGGQSVSAVDRLYLTAHMPTLIVWGDHDRIIPLDHAYLAHEAIPNSRLEVMEGVGHFPQVEEPVRFVEILRDFLRTTEPSTFDPEELLGLLRQGPEIEVGLTNTTSADPQL
jgi:pimeloyl-ACP methyl ester carboxylesterase